MQNLSLEVEKIKDIGAYDPDGTKEWAALKDDARIVAGWYATFLDPKKEIKFSEQDIIATAVRVYKEIARCKELDPEKFKYTVDPADMTEAAKKLWEKVTAALNDTEVKILLGETERNAEAEKDPKEETGKDKEKGCDQYAEVKPSGNQSGRKITVDEVLKKFDSFFLRKPFLFLVGGLANQGETTGDIDILVKAGMDLPESFRLPLEFRIYRMFASADRGRVHILYDQFHGPFTTHYALADLKVDCAETFTRVEMSKDLDPKEEGGDSGIADFEEIEKSLSEGDGEYPEEFVERANFYLEVSKARFDLTGQEGVVANREAGLSMRQNRIEMFRRFYPQKTSVSAMTAERVHETYSVAQTLEYLQQLHEQGTK